MEIRRVPPQALVGTLRRILRRGVGEDPAGDGQVAMRQRFAGQQRVIQTSKAVGDDHQDRGLPARREVHGRDSVCVGGQQAAGPLDNQRTEPGGEALPIGVENGRVDGPRFGLGREARRQRRVQPVRGMDTIRLTGPCGQTAGVARRAALGRFVITPGKPLPVGRLRERGAYEGLAGVGVGARDEKSG